RRLEPSPRLSSPFGQLPLKLVDLRDAARFGIGDHADLAFPRENAGPASDARGSHQVERIRRKAVPAMDGNHVLIRPAQEGAPRLAVEPGAPFPRRHAGAGLALGGSDADRIDHVGAAVNESTDVIAKWPHLEFLRAPP